MVCECQWGLTSMIFGIIIVCAAGVFAAFPAVLVPSFPVFFSTYLPGIFTAEWYIFLCWAWFILGLVLTGFGCIWECCGCQPQGRWAKSREETADEIACAPTPYIMIA